jgi:hypothetical protein
MPVKTVRGRTNGGLSQVFFLFVPNGAQNSANNYFQFAFFFLPALFSPLQQIQINYSHTLEIGVCRPYY